jgi:hypothetical protein
MDDADKLLILDWSRLSPDDIHERINWLRDSLVAGKDWGYCEEIFTCVLMNDESAALYRLRWFLPEGQELIPRPVMLDSVLGKQRSMEERERNVWW